MKITNKQLMRLINEEIENVLMEGGGAIGGAIARVLKHLDDVYNLRLAGSFPFEFEAVDEFLKRAADDIGALSDDQITLVKNAAKEKGLIRTSSTALDDMRGATKIPDPVLPRSPDPRPPRPGVPGEANSSVIDLDQWMRWEADGGDEINYLVRSPQKYANERRLFDAGEDGAMKVAIDLSPDLERYLRRNRPKILDSLQKAEWSENIPVVRVRRPSEARPHVIAPVGKADFARAVTMLSARAVGRVIAWPFKRAYLWNASRRATKLERKAIQEGHQKAIKELEDKIQELENGAPTGGPAPDATMPEPTATPDAPTAAPSRAAAAELQKLREELAYLRGRVDSSPGARGDTNVYTTVGTDGKPLINTGPLDDPRVFTPETIVDAAKKEGGKKWMWLAFKWGALASGAFMSVDWLYRAISDEDLGSGEGAVKGAKELYKMVQGWTDEDVHEFFEAIGMGEDQDWTEPGARAMAICLMYNHHLSEKGEAQISCDDFIQGDIEGPFGGLEDRPRIQESIVRKGSVKSKKRLNIIVERRKRG
jgi:hypothetical protein